MSYIKQGFTKGQTLKADHLNYMESGIEAIANNVQIKKAVFTDRQSVYEFLLENHSKTIYIFGKMTGYPLGVKFIPQMETERDGNGEFSVLRCFNLVELNMFLHDTDVPVIVPSCIKINENTTHYLFDPKIGFDSDGVTVVTPSQIQELPDAYWSMMNVELTAYYFGE